MGGGSEREIEYWIDDVGRSPRGRGKPATAAREACMGGSIPAWAGEALFDNSELHLVGVDPRVGGGSRGASDKYLVRAGRSPRGRGKLARSCNTCALGRSIPAWAGEARHDATVFRQRRVDPRVGGGSRRTISASMAVLGRSPRGRGKRLVLGHKSRPFRSIPAWAGEAVSAWVSTTGRWVDPRVGGGSNKMALTRCVCMGRSPRGRGKLIIAQASRVGAGSIPAWAGEAWPD